jgi:hypothetical protein
MWIIPLIQAVAISHYALITHVVQIAAHNKVNEDYCPWEDKRFRPSDVVLGGRYSQKIPLSFELTVFCSLATIPWVFCTLSFCDTYNIQDIYGLAVNVGLLHRPVS